MALVVKTTLIFAALLIGCSCNPIQIHLNVNVPDENTDPLPSGTVTLNEKTFIATDDVVALLDERFENMEESTESSMNGLDHKIKTMTEKINSLVDDVAIILQNQYDLINLVNQIVLTTDQETTKSPLQQTESSIMPLLPVNRAIQTQSNVSPTTDALSTSETPIQDCQSVSGPSRFAVKITPLDGLGSFQVICDFIDKEGWIVIQRRVDGQENFTRNWDDYENGFGDLNGEHWLGLKNIRRLVSDGNTWALRIDMEYFHGETAHAVYNPFSISDAESNYRLSVGEYSGTAGDSLKQSGSYEHNGRPFATYDKETSGFEYAHLWKGGWWYNWGLRGHLNGLYLGERYYGSKGIVWYTWKDYNCLKGTEMKIHRVQ